MSRTEDDGSSVEAVSEQVASWPAASRALLDGIAAGLPSGRVRLVSRETLPCGARVLVFERVVGLLLGERDQAMVDALCRGCANKEIAVDQGLACSTVSIAVRAAVARLGFSGTLPLLCTIAGLRAEDGVRRAVERDQRVYVSFHDDELGSSGALLTKAEQAVALQVLHGASNLDIAQLRRTSTNTVANQLRAIYGKLGVRSRREFSARYGQPFGTAA